MIHAAAFFSSLASLVLIFAIHACNNLVPRGSWLRAEVVTAILLSLLTGLYPIAVTAALTGLWQGVAGSLSGGAALSPAAIGADLASLAAVIATALVFRHTLKAGAVRRRASDNVTPLTPRPDAPRPGPQTMRRAA